MNDEALLMLLENRSEQQRLVERILDGEESKTVALILTGSTTNGFYTPTSDIDVYSIERYGQQDSLRNRQLEFNGIAVDIESHSLEEIDAIYSKITTAAGQSEIRRAWGISRLDFDIMNRTLDGLVIHDSLGVSDKLKRFSRKEICKGLFLKFQSDITSHQIDFIGMRAASRKWAARYIAEKLCLKLEMLFNVVSGNMNPSEKWAAEDFYERSSSAARSETGNVIGQIERDYRSWAIRQNGFNDDSQIDSIYSLCNLLVPILTEIFFEEKLFSVPVRNGMGLRLNCGSEKLSKLSKWKQFSYCNGNIEVLDFKTSDRSVVSLNYFYHLLVALGIVVIADGTCLEEAKTMDVLNSAHFLGIVVDRRLENWPKASERI